MVSLADRQYLQQLDSDLYTRSLIAFLFDKSVSAASHKNGNTADDVAISALHSVQRNDPESFDGSYGEIKRRKPKRDSDWIHNDLLLFALTAGVAKFDREPEWLLNVLQLRMENTDEEKRLITQTLLDAVNGNFESIDNSKPLMVVIKHFLSLSLGSEEYVNSTYRELAESSFPHYDSVLLNIVCLRAIDLIVFHKKLGSMKWYQATDAFLDSFVKRVRQLSWSLWLLTFAVVGLATLYFWYYYLGSISGTRDNIEAILRLLPSLGVTSLLAPLLTFRKQIIGWFEACLLRFFRYQIPEQNRSLE